MFIAKDQDWVWVLLLLYRQIHVPTGAAHQGNEFLIILLQRVKSHLSRAVFLEVNERRRVFLSVASGGALPGSQVRAPSGIASVGEEPGDLPSGDLSVDGPVAGLLPGVGGLEVCYCRRAAPEVIRRHPYALCHDLRGLRLQQHRRLAGPGQHRLSRLGRLHVQAFGRVQQPPLLIRQCRHRNKAPVQVTADWAGALVQHRHDLRVLHPGALVTRDVPYLCYPGGIMVGEQIEIPLHPGFLRGQEALQPSGQLDAGPPLGEVLVQRFHHLVLQPLGIGVLHPEERISSQDVQCLHVRQGKGEVGGDGLEPHAISSHVRLPDGAAGRLRQPHAEVSLRPADEPAQFRLAGRLLEAQRPPILQHVEQERPPLFRPGLG